MGKRMNERNKITKLAVQYKPKIVVRTASEETELWSRYSHMPYAWTEDDDPDIVNICQQWGLWMGSWVL
jgi:hypothetical protein